MSVGGSNIERMTSVTTVWAEEATPPTTKEMMLSGHRMDAYKAAIALMEEATQVLDSTLDENGIDINDVLRVARFLAGVELPNG